MVSGFTIDIVIPWRPGIGRGISHMPNARNSRRINVAKKGRGKIPWLERNSADEAAKVQEAEKNFIAIDARGNRDGT